MADLPTSQPGKTLLRRTLEQPNLICYLSEIPETDALFVSDEYTTEELLNDVDPKYISETAEITEDTRFCIGTYEDYLELCKTRRNVHKVDYNFDGNSIVWRESNIGADVDILRKIALTESYIDEFEVQFDLPVTIIFADHGMGKTTQLHELKDDLFTQNPKAYALFLNDDELSRYFNSSVDRNVKTFTEFYNIDKANPDVHLFFDNFEYLREIEDLINIFTEFHFHHRNVKLWMTCSKSVTRAKLESKFGTFACYLCPIPDELQVKFLKDIWGIDSLHFDSYITEILKLCNHYYWGPLTEDPFVYKDGCSKFNLKFTQYPLHLEMIGANFKPNKNTPPLKISILEIFENFIQKNYKANHLEELAVVEFCKNLDYKFNFENINLPSKIDLQFSSIINYLAAKWFSSNIKGFKDLLRLIVKSEYTNWQFEYFVDRFLCQDNNLHTAVLNRDLESVQLLCASGDVNEIDAVGRTALHLCNDPKMAEILIQNGARFNVKDDIHHLTPLALNDLTSNIEIIEVLLKNNADFNELSSTLNFSEAQLDKRFNYALLYKAIEYIKVICQNCKQLKITSDIATQIFHVLSEDLVLEVLKLAEGVAELEMALHLAVNMKYFEAVKYLIDVLKVDIYHKYHNGNTLLHIACEGGDINIVSYLIGLGLDLNVVNDDGWNCFLSSCQSGNVEMIKFLVKKGVNTDITTSCGITALNLALNYRNADAVEYLYENAGDFNLKDVVFTEDDLFTAMSQYNLRLIQFMMANSKIDINAKRDGNSLLHLSSRIFNEDIVKYLLNAGADVNAKDDEGCTPLFLVVGNNVEAFKVLIENGADVSATNNRGENVLFKFYNYCIGDPQINHLQCIELLLSSGLDVNARSISGDTALHCACSNNSHVVVKCLLDHGADVNIVNNNGDSPLHMACANDRDTVAMVSVLLSKNPDVNLRNKLGETPIMKVVQNHEVYSELLKYGADLHCRDNNGRNLIHVCANYGFVDILEFLKKAGLKDAKIVDNLGQTALHIAAKSSQFETFKYLYFNFETDVNIVDNDGKKAIDLTDNLKIKSFIK